MEHKHIGISVLLPDFAFSKVASGYTPNRIHSRPVLGSAKPELLTDLPEGPLCTVLSFLPVETWFLDVARTCKNTAEITKTIDWKGPLYQQAARRQWLAARAQQAYLRQPLGGFIRVTAENGPEPGVLVVYCDDELTAVTSPTYRVMRLGPTQVAFKHDVKCGQCSNCGRDGSKLLNFDIAKKADGSAWLQLIGAIFVWLKPTKIWGVACRICDSCKFVVGAKQRKLIIRGVEFDTDYSKSLSTPSS